MPRRLLATIIAMLAPIVVLVGYLTMRAHVPDPLPVHWNIHGEVDNTASVQGFFVTILVITAALAAAVVATIWLAHSPMAGRLLASLLTFGAWMMSAVAVVTLAVSVDAKQASVVMMPWYAIAAVVVVPIAIALGIRALLPSAWPSRPVQLAKSSLSLAHGEAVTWTGHAHSTVLRVISVVLALAGAVVLIVAPAGSAASIAVPVLIGAVVFALVSELGVRIDERGVHTLWGPFGWPRPRIALSNIVAAGAEEIRPMAWGGWGYRVSGKGVAAVVRGGPGLVIERSAKPTYAVTVDQAADGADVLNALLNREHAAAGGEAGGEDSGEARGDARDE